MEVDTGRKFNVGDEVSIRPFDEIDHDDIGRVGFNSTSCFSIPRKHINEQSVGGGFTVREHDFQYGAHIYRLKDMNGSNVSYWWAQGMLRHLYDDGEIGEADEDALFGFLLS